MSRPKGSKNKKSLIPEAQIEEKIAAQQAVKEKLLAEQQELLDTIDGYKAQLKEKKKELKAVDKALTSLQEKKEQAEAMAAAQAQKAQVEKVVSTLISSGKSAEEILDLLNQ